MDPESELDLGVFVAEVLPQLQVEAEDGWSNQRPATELMSEDSPLAAYLRAPGEPPEGSRAERAAFWEERAAAEAAAREAAAGAVADHSGWVRIREQQAAANAFDGRVSEATKRRRDGEQGTRETAKGPDQPAVKGWW